MEGELTLRLNKKDLEALAELVFEKLKAVLPHPVPAAGPEDLMTAKEVQELLNIKPSTFYEWRKNQDFPKGLRFGPKEMRWRRADIMNYGKKEAP